MSEQETVDCSNCNIEIKTEKELGELRHDGAICKQCKYNEDNPAFMWFEIHHRKRGGE